jgi:hypothetical protein
LVCGFAPVDKARPVWLIADSGHHPIFDAIRQATTQLYKRDDTVVSIAQLGRLRPRLANPIIDSYLNNRYEPRLFFDWGWEWKPAIQQATGRHLYTQLVGQCLRFHLHSGIKQPPPQQIQDEWVRLFHRVANTDRAARSFRFPEYLEHIILLLCKLNLELDEVASFRNVGIAYSQLCIINGNERPTDTEHLSIHRLIVESVRPWVKDVLRHWENGRGYDRVRRVVESTAKIQNKTSEGRWNIQTIRMRMLNTIHQLVGRGVIIEKGRGWYGPGPDLIDWYRIRGLKEKWW